jgi:2-amino-4-hydroxy-6-hydroxymethyldihydropteridine diphosphokinase
LNSIKPKPPNLAIALGANLLSRAGPPLATLLAVRPLLAVRLAELRPVVVAPLTSQPCGGLRWSPLFRTAAVGGPPG